MFLELLRKEFIEKKVKSQQSTAAHVLSLLLKFLLLGCFVALEVYIFLNLDKKIEKYSSYGSFDFLVLFLFAMMVVGVFFSMVKARNAIFNQKDSRVTMPLPIPPSTQVAAKVTYIYIESVLFELLTSTPLLMTYGVPRHYIPYYHIFSILYPLFISVFIVGLALLFSLVYQQFYKLIKKSDIAQFITASVLVVSLCYLYQLVLNLFLNALNDSSIGGVFSESFVKSLHKARVYFLPVYQYADALIEKSNLRSDILIILGASFLVLILGVGAISLVYYHEIKNEDRGNSKTRESKQLRLTTPFKSLIKKEMDLLFKDEGNMFSYTSLLIMCPFLTYVVISSLNNIIYDNLRFYAAYFPELVSGINLMLVLLFSGVINASASLAMTREGKALKIVKILPISPIKQIFSKIMIPMFFSEVSLLLTAIVLISSKVITLPVFLSVLFIGTLTILFNNIFGVYADMHDMSSEERKIKMSIINELVPMLLPLVLFLIFFVFSITLHLPSWSLYLIGNLFSALVLLPFGIGLKKRYQKAFVRMEVSN